MRFRPFRYGDVVLVSAAIVAFFANTLFSSPWLGGGAALLWIGGVVSRVLRWRMIEKEAVARLLFGVIFVGSVVTALFVIQMFVVGMYSWVSVGSFTLATCLIFLVPSKEKATFSFFRRIDHGALWLGVTVFTDALIILLLSFARTESAIISPWNFFSGELFILYFVATCVFILGSWSREDHAPLMVGFFHTLTTLSVTSVVFATGFGFDPFIHRAAESALIAQGSIEPQRLLYSGQYALVAGLHQITALPLKQIDIWLVPLVASFLLPLAGFIGLRDGWKVEEQWAKVGWLGVFFFPFMLVTFSVPFTMTYAWFLAMLFLLPAGNTLVKNGVLILGSGMMILFHPLLAVPTLIFTFLFPLLQKIKKTGTRMVIAGGALISLIGGIPAMFVLYQRGEGQGVLINGLFTRIPAFTSLFRSPYTDPYPFIPWYLDRLYDFRYLLPMVAFVVGLYLLFCIRKQHPEIFSSYILLIAGLLGSIYGVSTMFSFKNIISHEQAEFSLRLLTAWYAIALPVLAVFLGKLFERKNIQIGMAVVLSMLLTVSWFFSYPQFNSKYPYFSPSVSEDDVAAVQEIEKRSNGEPYIVLSNQMTSVAALQEFSFAHYVFINGEEVLWYPIPTGGVLYGYYTRIIIEGPREELFRELYEKTGVKKIYFLTHAYWPWYEGFIDALQQTSDQSFSINKGKITIYEYVF